MIIHLSNEKTSLVAPIPKSPNLILVYTQKEQKDTIAICEQLRKDPEGVTAPILLVIRQIQNESLPRTSQTHGKYNIHNNSF